MSGTQFLQVPCGLGAKNGDMDKIHELLVNVVIFDKRKGTGTLEPKGKGGMVRMVGFHPTQSAIPPANRQILSHCVELKIFRKAQLSSASADKQAVT